MLILDFIESLASLLLYRSNHNYIYHMNEDIYVVRAMDGQNPKSCLLKNSFEDDKTQRLAGKLVAVSLRDIPLEVRRKEAKKPMFLKRYE